MTFYQYYPVLERQPGRQEELFSHTYLILRLGDHIVSLAGAQHVAIGRYMVTEAPGDDQANRVHFTGTPRFPLAVLVVTNGVFQLLDPRNRVLRVYGQFRIALLSAATAPPPGVDRVRNQRSSEWASLGDGIPGVNS